MYRHPLLSIQHPLEGPANMRFYHTPPPPPIVPRFRFDDAKSPRCLDQNPKECLYELHHGRFEGSQQYRCLGGVVVENLLTLRLLLVWKNTFKEHSCKLLPRGCKGIPFIGIAWAVGVCCNFLGQTMWTEVTKCCESRYRFDPVGDICEPLQGLSGSWRW